MDLVHPDDAAALAATLARAEAAANPTLSGLAWTAQLRFKAAGSSSPSSAAEANATDEPGRQAVPQRGVLYRRLSGRVRACGARLLVSVDHEVPEASLFRAEGL